MSLFGGLSAFGARDVAIDLGTANTLVFEQGRGIVLSEPSVVAIDTQTGEVHAVGDDAKRMIGRTPATIAATRPLRHGVIADFEVTEQMLRHFIGKVQPRRRARPQVVMCAPSGITDVEQRALEEACLSAGARRVGLIEEPIAAAIGAGLPIEEPTGRMVVDIGGGTSEVAVITMGQISVARSLRVGGHDLDDAILAHLRREHHLAVGVQMAEELKVQLGSAWPVVDDVALEVRGRDLRAGLPVTLTVTGEELRAVLAEPVGQIVATVRDTLEETPPELAGDVFQRGILLAGGGAMLQGLAERLEHETGVTTYLADAPLTCVALGAGRSLEEIDAVIGPGRARLSARG